MRRAFTNVQGGEDGYEHASRKLKDVFDAVAMALSEVKSGKGSRSMDVLAAGGSHGSSALERTRARSLWR